MSLVGVKVSVAPADTGKWPTQFHLGTNEFNLGVMTIVIGAGFLQDYVSYNQDSASAAEFDLERQGYIASDWGVTENNRQARFYKLTSAGRKRLAEERATWARMSRAVELVLRMGEAEA